MVATWIIVGVILGAVLTAVIMVAVNRRAQRSAEARKEEELAAAIEGIKSAFASLSREALSRNSEDFLTLAKTRLEQQTVAGTEQLESKKKLIDASLVEMTRKLGTLTELTQNLDKQRRESVGAIKSELAKTTEITGKLRETTSQLREVLANPKRRGSWGERMADDILQLAGFVEGVNYRKQSRVSSGEIPDFTFLLSNELRLNMDVKFPLDNYLRAVDARDEGSEKQFRAAFLRDVRNHLKAVTTREYIDPEGGTVECVLVFIANEQVYGYLHEHDRQLMDDAVRQRIVLCSPLSLYAVLSVIRQSVENFRLEKTSTEILELLFKFGKEWAKYCDVMDKMGVALNRALKQYEDLSTTRTRKLERQLDRIENLRQSQGLIEAESSTDRRVDQPHFTLGGDHG